MLATVETLLREGVVKILGIFDNNHKSYNTIYTQNKMLATVRKNTKRKQFQANSTIIKVTKKFRQKL